MNYSNYYINKYIYINNLKFCNKRDINYSNVRMFITSRNSAVLRNLCDIAEYYNAVSTQFF